ncbi:MAG: hypothetical protein KAH86_08855, partial [Methanosarcinales archaeon]|nr:hypothetical protein [Methanosarcinales archaeon]
MIHRVKIRSIILSLIVLGLFASSAMAVAPTITIDDPLGGDTVTGTYPITTSFTDPENNVTNVSFFYSSNSGGSWTLLEDDTSEPYGSNWITTDLPNGDTYQLKAVITDNESLTGQNISTSDITILNGGAISLSIPDQTAEVGTAFSLDVLTHTSGGFGVKAYTDNTSLFVIGATDGIIDFTPDTVATHTIQIDVTDGSGSDSDTFVLTIDPQGASGGNRIWFTGLDNPYTWTAQSFTGFYYDIDDNITTEEFEIRVTDRTIDDGDLEYTTTPQSVSFEFGSEWGKYDVVGFMAEKYFAGYNDDTKSVITDDSPSLLNDNLLSKVLTDSDEKYTLNQGDSLDLQEGYAIKINQLDINGNQVMLEILKDG